MFQHFQMRIVVVCDRYSCVYMHELSDTSFDGEFEQRQRHFFWFQTKIVWPAANERVASDTPQVDIIFVDVAVHNDDVLMFLIELLCV